MFGEDVRADQMLSVAWDHGLVALWAGSVAVEESIAAESSIEAVSLEVVNAASVA